EAVPRRTPGPRNLLPSVRCGAETAVRHADRRDGLRLWRFGELRNAGAQARRRGARQGLALYRLVAPPVDRAADRIRARGCGPPAYGLRAAAAAPREKRPGELVRRRDGGARRPG